MSAPSSQFSAENLMFSVFAKQTNRNLATKYEQQIEQALGGTNGANFSRDT